MWLQVPRKVTIECQSINHHTCVSMLLSISPWESTNTAKSRKICIKDNLIPEQVWSPQRLVIHYLLQIKKLPLNLFHCVMALLDLLQCVQYLQMRENHHSSLSASRVKFLQLNGPKELVPFLALAPEWLSGRFARRRLFLSACRLSEFLFRVRSKAYAVQVC